MSSHLFYSVVLILTFLSTQAGHRVLFNGLPSRIPTNVNAIYGYWKTNKAKRTPKTGLAMSK